jgi:hypothetical protein
MHRILIAAVAGLIAGLILHRGLGLRLVGVPLGNDAPAPPAPGGPRGAVEARHLQALHEEKLDDLRKRLAAAEQDCSELRAQVAATPKTPRQPSREEKVRTLGRLLTRMMRLASGKTPTMTPEMQRMLSDFMKLCTELGVDMSNSTTMFKNPEFTGGVFEGILDEYGFAGDPAARLEWKAGLASRLQSLGDNPSSLKLQQVAAQNLLDFYDRFGERLFEKDPGAARTMSAISAGSALSTSQVTRRQAADLLLKDVAATATLDEATKARLRPIAERWAAEYGAVITEATQANGEDFMASMMTPEKFPASNEAALAQIRKTIQFRIRALDVEGRALEEMGTQLDSDVAARLRKLDKAYYFKRIIE